MASSAGGSGSPPVLRVWIDAQLPPALADWLGAFEGVEAIHTFALGLLGASDPAILAAARVAGAVVIHLRMSTSSRCWSVEVHRRRSSG